MSGDVAGPGSSSPPRKDSDERDQSGPARTADPLDLEKEGEVAADYLEELLDIADLDGDIDMDVEGDRASVQIGGADLSQLVGRNGEVLEALQELTRLAVYRETGERVVLAPMSAFERKVVHDAVAAAGLGSESEGEEPRRRVVVLPA